MPATACASSSFARKASTSPAASRGFLGASSVGEQSSHGTLQHPLRCSKACRLHRHARGCTCFGVGFGLSRVRRPSQRLRTFALRAKAGPDSPNRRYLRLRKWLASRAQKGHISDAQPSLILRPARPTLRLQKCSGRRCIADAELEAATDALVDELRSSHRLPNAAEAARDTEDSPCQLPSVKACYSPAALTTSEKVSEHSMTKRRCAGTGFLRFSVSPDRLTTNHPTGRLRYDQPREHCHRPGDCLHRELLQPIRIGVVTPHCPIPMRALAAGGKWGLDLAARQIKHALPPDGEQSGSSDAGLPETKPTRLFAYKGRNSSRSTKGRLPDRHCKSTAAPPGGGSGYQSATTASLQPPSSCGRLRHG